ncbi:TIGR04222 domain-containing membrane protein [Pseudonocardia endophytica]|uniref:Uncharacterized protein (TIGR04222 family) n=1 Tax=Pseudonocardia endophytica TaxID=401976 RepID=A0A4R1HEG0_PSEEN|nr:TIGR04222 domain-containing membrane protein [Pseudonocardia endophytica]TCK20484.1 uncharacterized protein (TIGR04222 family) [Pseudonocardia endophytica]
MGPNETWGISGSTFLVIYIVLAVVVLGVAISIRRSLRSGRPVSADGLQSRPEDVAYLNGGPDLAVYAALSSMHVEGSIATSGPSAVGIVHSVGTARQASPLQNAIHGAAARPTPRRTLPVEPRVAAALAEIRDRLERAGLYLTEEQRRSYRRPAFLMLAVLAFGIVRAIAGVSNGRPVGFLSFLLFVVAGATLILFARVPLRTAAGDTALAAQRQRHTALSPSMRPDWGAVGAGGAALSVGVFGVGALLAAQPAFAEELEAQKSAAMGGGGGGFFSGDGGGGGGDGGGGGGCGGGGCGGGGCGG